MAPDDDARGSFDVLAWGLIALFGVVYALVAKVALHGFPFSGDEYSTFLQAELFARGLLHAPTPLHSELLQVDHVLLQPWVVSKYAPGTSALLALGVRAGVPWLVSPVEGVLTLILVWHTVKSELGQKAALVSLVTLGAAPLFLFQAANFYCHTATTLWLALSLFCTSAWIRSRRDAWLLGTGAALGLAFLTRQFDAVLLGAALLTLRSWRVVGFVAVGGAPFAALNFAYQAAEFGSPFRDGYKAYAPTHSAIYGQPAPSFSLANLLSGEELWNHLDVCRDFIANWSLAGSVVVAVLGAYAIGKSHPARPLRNILVALVALMLSALLFMWSDPDDGARPRYLSSLLLTVAFLAGPGWEALSSMLVPKIGRAMVRGLVVGAFVMVPAYMGSFFFDRMPKQWMREGLYSAAAEADASAMGGVVVVRARYPTRYARNGPFFDRPILYLSPPKTTTVDQIADLYPGRPIYEAIEGSTWQVVRRH